MDRKRGAFALLAIVVLLFLGMRGAGGGQPLGLDLNVGQERTHIVLSTAFVRFAFDFEHQRPKTDSPWGVLL